MAVFSPAQSRSTAAAAKQLNLGVATVTGVEVATAPTDILTLAIIEKRKIFPYRFDQATNTVFVAVADAAELKKPAPVELQQQRKLGHTLTLQLLDPAQFEQLLPLIRTHFETKATPAAEPLVKHQNSEPAVNHTKAATSSIPTIDLKTVAIPRSVLLKIPHDVATKFRVVVFEAPSDSTQVKLASDQPTDPGVSRVVAVIRDKRAVTAKLYQASQADINALLAAYQLTSDPISIAPVPVIKAVPIQVAEKPTIAPLLPSKPLLAVLPPLPKSASLLPPPAPHLFAVPVDKPMHELPTASQPIALGTPATAPAAKPELPKLPNVAEKPLEPAKTKSIPPVTPPVSAKTVDTMPVDTSAAATPVPAGGAKIKLVAPLPNALAGASFPLPTFSPAAQAYANSTNTAPAAGKPATPPLPLVKPPVVATPASASSTPAPVVASPVPPVVVKPITPINLTSPMATKPMGAATGTKPVTPFQQLGGSMAEVQKSEVANISAFAQLTTIQPTEEQDLDAIVGSTIQSPDELETVIRTGLVPKILAAILQYAINVGASDIHVEATVDSLRIRFRVDGVLQDMLKAPLGLDAPFVSRIKILAGMKIDEQRIPQDGRFTAKLAGREIDFRVSTLPAIHGEKVVMRILDKSVGVRSIDQLGMEGTNLNRLMEAIAKPFGIILVTGPTGSGKTTTLYAMLGTLNKPGVNIITLEDPVEYELIGITQTQVKPKIGFSFAEGLRSVLRQDPDIVMVGEIRDRETASLATHAALTGHLVLSTLHTNNAAGAIPRFLNMGVEPFLVASSIEAIVAQRLVRKLCDKCKQPVTLTEAMQKDIADTLNSSVVEEVKKLAAGPFQFLGPHGCAECHDGYRGRLGLYEVMSVTPEIETLTATKATVSDIQKIAEKQGMVTMKQDGILKALNGLTSLDEILRVTTGD